jgi:hypothetical protein
MDTRPDEAAEWHAARRRRRKLGCLAVLLTPIVIVAVLLAVFLLRILATPKITRNYTAEFNERFEAVPETDRAWPIYKQVKILQLTSMTSKDYEFSWPIYPQWKQWDQALEKLDELEEVLELIRRAARKPVLGKPLSDVSDQDIARARALAAGRTFTPEQASENPIVVDVLLEELGDFRKFAKYLVTDAFRRAQAGDAPGTVEDIETMLGLASHSGASTTLIGYLVQIAIENLTGRTTLLLLDEYPELFTDEELARLGRAFMEIGRSGLPETGGLTRLEYDSTLERAFFDDLVQRVYSDDGHGNGHVTLKGLKSMEEVFAWVGGGYGSGPVDTAAMLVFSAPRQAMVKRYNEYMDQYDALAARNLWEREQNVNDLERELNALGQTALARARYGMLWMILPSRGKATRAFDEANARRDATIVAIALHRYRRAHGAFPETLESLVPEFVPGLALDPVDGKPLRYVLSDSGPILYSLGGDGDDDGGIDGSLTAESVRNIQPGASSPEDGDWVLYPVAVPVEPEDEDE